MVVVAVLVIVSSARLDWLPPVASETEDAFVEAHIVNLAPQSVSGHLCRFVVEENDRVEQGQILAEIDPVLYRDKVNLARSKVDEAEAELRRQETALDRLRLEVPLQIEISKRTLAAARVDEARAQQALKLTEDEVEKSIQEARAGLGAATADLVLAQQEYNRFTTLKSRGGSAEASPGSDAGPRRGRGTEEPGVRQTRQSRSRPHRGRRGPEGLEAAEESTQKAAGRR